MKCEELLKALNEYVDGTLDVGVCDEFRSHLADCNPCKIVVDNVRRTISLYKAGKRFEMPAAFQEKLRATLRERWKARFSPPPPSTQALPPATGL